MSIDALNYVTIDHNSVLEWCHRGYCGVIDLKHAIGANVDPNLTDENGETNICILMRGGYMNVPCHHVKALDLFTDITKRIKENG